MSVRIKKSIIAQLFFCVILILSNENNIICVEFVYDKIEFKALCPWLYIHNTPHATNKKQEITP